MYFTRREHTRRRALQIVLAGLLIVGLSLAAVGCDSAGTNGDDGDDDDGDDPETVVPAAPTGLSATSGDGEVGLTWEAAEEADGYNVYRSTSSGVDPSEALSEGISETSYADTEVENGTTYYYMVTAVADEEGEASGEVEVTPFSEPPTRPEG